MKKALLVLSLFFGTFVSAQVVFSETFDEADDAVTGSDAIGPTTWTATCPGSIAATDYFNVESGQLEARDTNSPAAVWETGTFDVSACTGLEISFDIAQLGDMEDCADCGGTGTICIDWIKLEYNLDGGGWTEVAGTSCPVTMTEAPGEMIHTGDLAGGGPITYTSPCIDFGSTFQIRISCETWAATEYWQFDNITVSCNDCVLPVEIQNLNAQKQNNHIQITWSTLFERENDYFEIERSENGIDFIPLGTVQGAGNSSATLDYNFTDYTASLAPTNYYRLKQVDLNGQAHYSNTISLAPASSINFYYANDQLNYTTSKGDSRSYQLQIYNLGGQLMLSEQISGNGIINWPYQGYFLIKLDELGFQQRFFAE